MTDDEFIALTTEAGFEEGWVEVCKVRAELTRLIELAAAKEREACAQVVLKTVEWRSPGWVSTICPITKQAMAVAIRTRPE